MPLIVYLVIGKIVALAIGLYYFKYLPGPYKLVLYLVAIALACECYGHYLGTILKKHNAWLFNLYMPVDFLTMGFIVITMVKSKTLKLTFSALLIICFAIWIRSIYVNSLFVLATTALVCCCIVLTILFTVLLLTTVLFTNTGILKHPVFWLCFSSILFYACNIPYMGMHNYLLQHKPALAVQLYKIVYVLDVIRYPLVAISFILLGRQKQAVLKQA